VIWCPTNNDVASSAGVDPRGFLVRREQVLHDAFGDGMFRDYSFRFPASGPYLDRWRRAASEYGRASAWLGDHGVPVAFRFVARWWPGWPEWILREAGQPSWWAAAPEAWNDRKYRNAESHGTAEVNRLYALAAYRLAVAHRADWPALGLDQAPAPEVPEPRRILPVPSADGGAAPLPSPRGAAALPEAYRPEAWRKSSQPDPCSRTLECATGLMGRRAALLLRRAPESQRVLVTVERVDPPPFALYPLRLEVRVVAPAVARSTILVLPAIGPKTASAVLQLPVELAEGGAFEVELEAERAALDLDRDTLVSVVVTAIEQRP
jgi:hypothetical protein